MYFTIECPKIQKKGKPERLPFLVSDMSHAKSLLFYKLMLINQQELRGCQENNT
jgi:hypothetical protein